MHKREQIVCNKCGKKVKFIDGLLKEDFCQVTKEWGYFSRKDMKIYRFALCEDCYDKLIEGFRVPVIIEEKSEAL